jgi:hypothetical protein
MSVVSPIHHVPGRSSTTHLDDVTKARLAAPGAVGNGGSSTFKVLILMENRHEHMSMKHNFIEFSSLTEIQLISGIS